MTPLTKKKPLMLYDFIVLGKGGRRVEAYVELRKQIVMQETYPDETLVRRDEVDAYLLMGDYNFEVEGETYKVTKVYLMGFVREAPYIADLNKSIANKRLKMDYRRLKDADIKVAPKYF